MSNEIRIAWRNLWRNKRRTWTMISSMFFGVLICSFMTGMQEGMYSSMINNTVDKYLGYYQIQEEHYWEDKTINNSMPFDNQLLQRWSVSGTTFVPKLDTYALVAFEEKSRPVLVKGIDVMKEIQMSHFDAQLKEGEMLNAKDQSVIIGYALAKYLHVSLGDSLVFLGQGYHGQSAAALLPIKGIVKDPIPSVDKRLVYMPMATAQEFLSVTNRVSSVAVLKKDSVDGVLLKDELRSKIPNSLVVKKWDELQPELIQQIEGDRVGGDVFKIILFIVIGFGLLGTVTMMVAERKRELGIMLAVGMARKKLARILIYESFIMTFIGVSIGTFTSYIILSYFVQNPIPLTGDMRVMLLEMGWEPVMNFSNDILMLVKQGVVLVVMMVFISIYPWISVMRLKEHLAVRE
ncbi:ABC transporter permease [Halosquirtibacter xylanolyticus]|uniref:ABC transporter permease n=1 Tax=Halosquirtibacter xylanolyticus TaxID=3374599 RepID=UPI00374A97B0|nr:ABC transporter permease [Prolixibacteraceae bacterium]